VPSSSSSAPEQTFAVFLRRALDLFARELPWAYEAMCKTLAGREVRIHVDPSPLGVRAIGDVLHVHLDECSPAVECTASHEAVIALIDARTTLTQAVLDDQISLRGSVDDLLAFHDALMQFVGGAVRSPSFPRLLRDYRAQCATMSEGTP
jgi:hypothetical protein